MDITRRHFDEERLVLMDEIAFLVLAAQTLRAAGPAFENTEDIRVERTFDTAKPVLKFLESTARDLLEVTFARKTKQVEMAASAHEKAGETLRQLMPNIEKLAKLEIAMYKDHGRDEVPNSTNIRDFVLMPLSRLQTAWVSTLQ
jgi:hypothetical protein